MATGNFPNCNAFTRKEEGGWSDHPSDPGGKTMNGVTQGTYDDFRRKKGLALRSVRNITRAEADEIYYTMYWKPVNGENLPMGVDLAAYDAGVNSGPSRANKWAAASKDADPVKWVQKLCAQRLGFVQALKTWKTFGKGWSARIARAEATGVKWALSAKGADKATADAILNKNSKEAEKKANNANTGIATGGAGVGGSGGTALADPSNIDQVAGLILGGVFVVAVGFVAVMFVRSIVQKNRAKAYAEAAQ